MQLAQGGLSLRLAGIATPTRQRPLRAMGAQARGAARQQQRGFAGFAASGQRDGDRGALQRRRRLAVGETRERRAALGAAQTTTGVMR